VKSMSTIRRHKAALRKIIDENRTDPVLARVAYAMERAIVWVAYPVVGDEPPEKLARDLAAYLRDDIRSGYTIVKAGITSIGGT